MRRSQAGSSPCVSNTRRSALLGLAFVVAAGLSTGCSDDPTSGQSTEGSLLITVTTLGPDPDREYTVVIDDEDSYPLNQGSAVVIPDVPIGEYTIELRDIAGNCTVTTANPRSATVIRGFEIGVPFVVECVATGGGEKPGEPGTPAE